jgi:hypothetical protein
MRDRIVAVQQIFDKVKSNASNYTTEELSWLAGMESQFLLQALWGTYLGSVSPQLRNMVQDRLKQVGSLSVWLKRCAVQSVGELRFAGILSKYRSTKAAKRNESLNKLSMKDVLENMFPCFETVL